MENKEILSALKHKNFGIEELNSILLIYNVYTDINNENDYTLSISSLVGISLYNANSRTPEIIATLDIEAFIREYINKFCSNITDNKIPFILNTLNIIANMEADRLNKILRAFRHDYMPKNFIALDCEKYAVPVKLLKSEQAYIIYDNGIELDSFNKILTHTVWMAIASAVEFKDIIGFDIINKNVISIPIGKDEWVNSGIEKYSSELRINTVRTMRKLSTIITNMPSEVKESIMKNVETIEDYNAILQEEIEKSKSKHIGRPKGSGKKKQQAQ